MKIIATILLLLSIAIGVYASGVGDDGISGIGIGDDGISGDGISEVVVPPNENLLYIDGANNYLQIDGDTNELRIDGAE